MHVYIPCAAQQDQEGAQLATAYVGSDSRCQASEIRRHAGAHDFMAPEPMAEVRGEVQVFNSG